MEHTTSHVLFFVLLLSSSLIDESFAKRHREADLEFFKAKLNGEDGSDVDKFLFSAFSVSGGGGHREPRRKKEEDRIYKLPGQPPVRFKQYGGYVTVDASAGRAFYYYFVEAQKPKHLPLLLWLNGGPGCSSLGYGAMEELGPFRVGSDGKTLFKNKFAWNNVANIIFLESPAGVGFSYSNTTSDFVKGGDRNTASDNYKFLLNWLDRFPEYKCREFYIAGESYAGHYVPQLASLIAHHKNPVINLQGILVGNGVINDETDTRGMFDYWASHALISPQIQNEIYKNCNFSVDIAKSSKQCLSTAGKAYEILGEIDIYNIYYPQCPNDDDVVLTKTPKPHSIMNIDPCSDGYVHAYLNRPDVQEALHANITKLGYDWQPCSDVLVKWTDGASTVLPNLKELMEKGIRVWLFSGDVDGRVPVTGTQYSIEAMKVPIQTPWHAWYLDGEVGGYVQSYKKNLMFVTVRGAGHQAPSYRPDRSLALVSHFITMKPLPSH